MWRFCLALIKSSPLLGWGEFEVAHLHDLGEALKELGTLVATGKLKYREDIVDGLATRTS